MYSVFLSNILIFMGILAIFAGILLMNVKLPWLLIIMGASLYILGHNMHRRRYHYR